MSWDLFRENVLRVANAPENINNIDLVAETYAREYDAAIKRGGDTISHIKLTKGNVDSMKQFFKMALEKGLSSKANYDLVGEMGAGVISYWTMGTMANIPPPFVSTKQIFGGAIANLVTIQNVITNPGKWGVIQIAGSEVKLKPEQTEPLPGSSNETKGTADALKEGESVLFIGDSITEGPYNYPAQIAKLKPNIKVDTLAISGKQTTWMLQNLPDKLAQTKYNKVYIYGGVNDMFSGISISKAVSNVQKMVDLINGAGSKAYVIVGYANSNMDYTKMATTVYVKDKTEYIPMISKYKEYQAQIQSTITGAKFVGIFDIGTLSDGFHPSASQAKKIANIILQAQ
jgi:lysophospholipase L1-like esterase